MMRLVGFELNKMIRSKKNIIVLILLVAAVSYLSVNIWMFGDPLNTYISDAEVVMQSYKDNLTMMQKAGYEEKVKEIDTGLKLLDDCRKQGFLNETYLNWHINYINNNDSGFTRYEKQYYLEADKYLIANKTVPEQFGTSSNGIFILQTITYNEPLLIPLFLLIFIGDIFNKEYRKGTHKLLFTQPFKKEKIIFAKYIASIIYCIGASVAAFIPGVIFTGVAYGFGSLSYPMQLANNFLSLSAYSKPDSYIIVPAYTYFLLHFAAFIILVVALSAITLLISCFFKRTAISISFVAIIVIAAKVLFIDFCLLPLNVNNIFTYCNIDNIMSGYSYIVLNLGQNAITFADGLLVLPLYIAAFAGGSLIFIKHKQFDN